MHFLNQQRRPIRLVSLAIAIHLALAALAPAETSGESLVPNGGFEEWTMKYEMPGKSPVWDIPEMPDGAPKDGYVVLAELGDRATDPNAPNGITLVRDELEKHEGSVSVRIESTEKASVGSLYTPFFVVEPKTHYRVTVWVRADNVHSHPKQAGGIYIWTSSGARGGWEKLVSVPHLVKPRQASFDWVQTEFTFETSEEAQVGRIGLQLRWATGKVWFDALEVVRADAASGS